MLLNQDSATALTARTSMSLARALSRTSHLPAIIIYREILNRGVYQSVKDPG